MRKLTIAFLFSTGAILAQSYCPSGYCTTLTETSSSSSTYTFTLPSPILSAYPVGAGQLPQWMWKVGTSCSGGAITGNINAVGAHSIVNNDGSNPTTAQCASGQHLLVTYDSVLGKFVILSGVNAAINLAGSGAGGVTGVLPLANLPTTTVGVKYFGTAAPVSPAGNLPGDFFTDTTNHNEYVCMAASGTAAPACTSVTTGGWTQINNGGGTGMNQLTGDVTAGPGSGSQTATVVKVNGVAISGTPSTGYVPTATSSTTATWQVQTSGSSDRCSALMTVAGSPSVITTPTTCVEQTGQDSAPVSPSAADTLTLPAGTPTGVVLKWYDAGVYYYGYNGFSPTLGAGATGVPATTVFPAGANGTPVRAIAYYTVTAGVVSAQQVRDNPSQNAYSFVGLGVSTTSGVTTVTNTGGDLSLATTATTSETLASTVCGGLRAYTSSSAKAVSLPTAGTSGFAADCKFSLLNNNAAGSITITPVSGTIEPSSCGTVAPNTSVELTSDGTSKYYCRPGAGGTGSGTTTGLTTFTASGTFTPATGVNRVRVQGWSGGAGGGGGKTSTPEGGTGGGGGGYIDTWCSVTPGVGVTVTVGAAGAAGVAGTNTAGAGGDTLFGSCFTVKGAPAVTATHNAPGYNLAQGSLMMAFWRNDSGNPSGFSIDSYYLFASGIGGNTGYTYHSARPDGGGPGGMSATGTNHAGGGGGTADFGGGGGGGGSADFGAGTYSASTGGASGYGGAGGNSSAMASGTAGACTAGTAPGGGGGGGAASNTSQSAGCAGARGEVRVWW